MNIFNQLIVTTIIINVIAWGLLYKLISVTRYKGKHYDRYKEM